jgi:hypothetical protein
VLKKDGVVQALTWAITFLQMSVKRRMKDVETAISGYWNRINHLSEKKQINKDMIECINAIMENSELVGIAPQVSYMMVEGSKEELQSIWVHPFSVPTLLLKVKNAPMLIMVNANLDYNDSVLTKIEHNEYHDELMKTLKLYTRGITG